MISGKKCRHLNKAGVDIRGQGGKFSPADFTIDWFLRHNHSSEGNCSTSGRNAELDQEGNDAI
ncbi:hypothetical protein AVDCRST_MAG94-5282 [uncultured Leptolyngbya sp.]|uniref:Uncharacterized protein n=1 Tax=uncultured Leptolyngbya sp. TaxID=332963 RepID=A0A6J4NI27_9CYAN|nr:hypothetical protein AVDCRST_MAG94-5282 [uncultured Leptolyngbya sp.]